MAKITVKDYYESDWFSTRHIAIFLGFRVKSIRQNTVWKSLYHITVHIQNGDQETVRALENDVIQVNKI